MYKSHIRRIVFFGVLGLVVALAVALLSPKIYEGRLEMLLGDEAVNRQTPSTLTPDVQNIVDRGRTQGAQTERQLLSSQSVFYQALARVAEERGRPDLIDGGNWVDYYRKYDIEMARTTNQQVDAGVALILVRAYDPEIAADVANKIGEVYNDVKKRQARDGVSEGLRYLAVQIPLAERNLREAEAKYREYKEKEGVADFLQVTRDETLAKTNLNQSIEGLTAQLRATEAELARQRQQLRDLPKEQLEGRVSSVSPQVQAFEQRLAELKTQREVLLGTYLPDSPNVKSLDDAITVINQKLVAERSKGFSDQSKSTRMQTTRQAVEQAMAANEAKRDSLTAQIASLRESYQKQVSIVGSMPAKEVQLVQLERDKNIADEQYRLLKRMQQELQNRSETGARSAVVLNVARPDEEAIAPQPGKFAIIGLTAGLCLGLLVSFLMESLKQRVQSSAQLSELTGLPVVAAVPELGRGGGPRTLRALTQPDAIPSEAYRFMAFSHISERVIPMSVMFTGVKTPAGSQHGAVQFALSAARAGSKVLLVDADLSRAAITKSFDMGPKKGLSNVVASDEPLSEDLLASTSHANLKLLPAGDGPAKFLSDCPLARLQEVVAWASKQAEVVVWAAPPCDVLADASCLAPWVDDVCMVVSGKTTNYRAVPVAHDLLVRAGAKKVSLVLNDASPDEEPFARTSTYLARAE